MNKFIITAVCSTCFASTMFGWSKKGHDVTAAIAEAHLTPEAGAMVDELLDGKSLVYWANWLDNASNTPEYKYTKTWHYKNVNKGVRYEEMGVNPAGDAVLAIKAQIETLTDSTASQEQKELALKILVHVVGDIHQPMHMGHASDLGGNRWNVRFFKNSANLHSVWDSRLPETAHKWSHTEWQREIDRLPYDRQVLILKDGNPDTWGKETYEICTRVYEATPEGTNIEYDYIADWTPTIESQLLKGGLRLADVLNSIFDPSYTPLNSFVRK